MKHKTKKLIFVVHEHHSRKLHYDLRLEIKGTLKSWAVTKKPPLKPGLRRLAIPTDDHPMSYGKFEGTIPEGFYGAGKVKIWDKGTYALVESKKKAMVIDMKGKKLKGNYVLVKFKTREGKPGYLFFKSKHEKKPK